MALSKKDPRIIGNIEEPEEPDPYSAIIGYNPKAMFITKVIPKAPPVYPPPELFKMPKYSKEILAPVFTKVVFNQAGNVVKNIREKINSFKNDLEYMNPIPYEDLVNDAVNRNVYKSKGFK